MIGNFKLVECQRLKGSKRSIKGCTVAIDDGFCCWKGKLKNTNAISIRKMFVLFQASVAFFNRVKKEEENDNRI